MIPLMKKLQWANNDGMWPAFTVITLSIEAGFYFWLIRSSKNEPIAIAKPECELIELYPAIPAAQIQSDQEGLDKAA